VIDGLRVGEIGKYPLCGLGDDVLTVRHGVPQCLAIHDEEKQHA
jgi:hypothetical protein